MFIKCENRPWCLLKKIIIQKFKLRERLTLMMYDFQFNECLLEIFDICL